MSYPQQPQQGYYPPPQGQYPPPQPYPPQMQYQAPPPEEKKDRGCLTAWFDSPLCL
ncbi:hypothetical protein KXV92_007677 [Aspergillus fumigatus]|nr:hypothetical protein KXV69_005854 [Aspergillus fumigatus]KMK58670.1 hypothetical protein Y699_07897 [Aspergillus fumigatus Z5]KAH2308935.1 hypothetical protein KXV47_006047 [Aspergillus fumigatus]KAH2760226.1 hypothetical protein KXV94_007447 [Aspergillus fumigatus]KAH3206836.1 hypothetical protein KXW62_000875 [Aspergillus fumigatus]